MNSLNPFWDVLLVGLRHRSQVTEDELFDRRAHHNMQDTQGLMGHGKHGLVCVQSPSVPVSLVLSARSLAAVIPPARDIRPSAPTPLPNPAVLFLYVWGTVVLMPGQC